VQAANPKQQAKPNIIKLSFPWDISISPQNRIYFILEEVGVYEPNHMEFLTLPAGNIIQST
jgi:hypothetical protein